ncbi:hypothetical protein P5673_022892 [Acropora cervicornis]|uniref:C2H2-type domain-containing protein n=1 Tax=Acropora cervicornis TaxID=6130 RepID=A0AAD9Q6N3_ACRCE|nr:hypothetical protein P5673_022892 [Acropora cervicornis]
MAWRCLLCSRFAAFLLASLLTHYNSEHSDKDQKFKIRCGLDDCDKEYSKVNSFTKHVRSSHHRYLLCSSSNDTGGEPSLTSGVPSVTEEDECKVNEGSVHLNEVNTSCMISSSDGCDLVDYCGGGENEKDYDDEDDPVQVIVTKFLYKIKGENRLTGTALQNIGIASRHLLHGILTSVKRKVGIILNNTMTEEEDLQTINNVFDEAAEETNILAFPPNVTRLNDNHACGNVEPVKHVLGKRRKVVKRGNKRKIQEVEDVFFYISVLKTIQLQLCCPKLLQMVLAGPQKSANQLFDFCDGTFFQEHPLFSNDETALALLVYYDDVNFVNPMTNKYHKLSFFYYQLANLHPMFRSKLKSIHLFAVCRTELVSLSQYGFNKILEPFVNEMKILGCDRGFTFTLPSGCINLRGGILAFLADTPASQKAGGFKEGVGGAKRKCRHCMATFEDMQTCFEEDQFELRNLDDHHYYLAKLEGASSENLRAFYSKCYGINTRTVLLESPYFDPCEQLIQDVMHVFLEGVLGYEIRFLLKYYLRDINAFTLDSLNSKIQGFSYGYSSSKDKPAVLLVKDLEKGSSTNLGQSASQMWLLCSILPLILADIVDITTDKWRCFIGLIEIMSICFSHKISEASVVYLHKAIKDHLILFKRLYGHLGNITPKQHYLVHLPSLILKFGPLVRSWCMRFEAKHAYFKDQAKIIQNFKNLPLSLSKRYQSSVQADYVMLGRDDPGPLFKDEVKFGNSKELQGSDCQDAMSDIKRFYDLGINWDLTKVYSVDSVCIHGTLYKPDQHSFLIFGKRNALPDFGRIRKIWFVGHCNIFFALQVVTNSGYMDSINAFVIEEEELPQGYEVIKHSELESPFVYHSYKFQDKNCIVLKENPFS